MTMRANVDDKLDALAEYPLQRNCCKQFNEDLNEMERSFFASTSSSIGWIGTVVSPICSFTLLTCNRNPRYQIIKSD